MKILLFIPIIMLSFLISCSNHHRQESYLFKPIESPINAIVGGTPVDSNKYSDIKMIRKKLTPEDENKLNCSGFFIHPYIFITAAHCLPAKDEFKFISVNEGYNIPIEISYRHPHYKNNLYSLKDIGIVITKIPYSNINFNFDDLLTDKEDFLSEMEKTKNIFLFGYGYQDDYVTKGELRTGDVSIKDFNHEEILTFDIDTYASGADSGGPALIEDRNGRKKIIGLISRWKIFSNNTKGTYLTTFIQNKDFICNVLKKEQIIGAKFCDSPLPNAEKDFTDKILTKRINENEIDSIRILDLSGTFIKDLTPLKKLENLEYLNIAENMITDLSPLLNLKKLKAIDISFNQIEKINLPGKIQIKGRNTQINFSHNSKFWEFCSNSKKISSLTFNTIVGISRELHTPFRGYPTLTQCKDLNFKLMSAKSLNLSNLEIVDIAPLEGLPLLKYLDLSQNKIIDISPLLTLESLEYVDLSKNTPHNLNLLLTKKIKKREGFIFHFQSFWEGLK